MNCQRGTSSSCGDGYRGICCVLNTSLLLLLLYPLLLLLLKQLLVQFRLLLFLISLPLIYLLQAQRYLFKPLLHAFSSL